MKFLAAGLIGRCHSFWKKVLSMLCSVSLVVVEVVRGGGGMLFCSSSLYDSFVFGGSL